MLRPAAAPRPTSYLARGACHRAMPWFYGLKFRFRGSMTKTKRQKASVARSVSVCSCHSARVEDQNYPDYKTKVAKTATRQRGSYKRDIGSSLTQS